MQELLELLSNEDRLEVLELVLRLKAKRGLITFDDHRMLAFLREELRQFPKAA